MFLSICCLVPAMTGLSYSVDTTVVMQVVNSNGTGCMACPALTWPVKEVKDGNQSTVNLTKLRCVSIIPTALQPGEPVALVLVILAIASALIALAVIGVYTVHRNHRLIKATSRELSAVVISGKNFFYYLSNFECYS